MIKLRKGDIVRIIRNDGNIKHCFHPEMLVTFVDNKYEGCVSLRGPAPSGAICTQYVQDCDFELVVRMSEGDDKSPYIDDYRIEPIVDPDEEELTTTFAPAVFGQAMRANNGKTQLSYLMDAPHAMNDVCQVFMFGTEKYARNNWKQGLPYKSVADSMMRHLMAFLGGEDYDPESGLPHTGHIMCNAVFLAEFFHSRKEFDDRD